VKEDNIHREKLLVKELIQGNERAFRKIYDTYRDPIYGYGLTLLKSRILTEELVQEVFIKLWAVRASLDVSKSIKAFLFTMTRNMAFNVLKKAARDIKLQQELLAHLPSAHNHTETAIREAELDQIKQQAVASLSPKRRLIFEMSRNEGMSYEDISLELGISPHTVKSQMSKALDGIRTFLMENKDISLIIALISSNWLK